MSTTDTTIMTVYRHADGSELGEIEVLRCDALAIEDGCHADFQWPEGVAKAGELPTILDAADLERLGVGPAETVYFE